MPTIPLADLVAPKTAAEQKQALLDALALKGFPVSSWHAGGVGRTLVEVDAEVLADLSSTVAALARGGFLDFASGAWLTLLAEEFFDVQRQPAVATELTAILLAAPSSGPHTISVGQLTAATASGLKFTNKTGGTLTAGGTLSLAWQAETPGAAYNIADNALTTLLTPIAGVSVNNPGPDSITTRGTDEEGDDELRERCRDRWAQLGPGATAATYRAWAQEASAQVTRVKVSAEGGGEVSVIIAGDGGGLASEVVDEVQAYVDERAPLTVAPVVASADEVAVDVTAILYGPAAYASTAVNEATAALQALIRATPIGGTVYRNAIIEALMLPEGVVNCSLTTPSGDVELGADEVARVGTLNISFSAV